MDTNSVPFASKVGQVEVASSEMVNKSYLHLKIQTNAIATHGKELEINTCGPMTDNLELAAVPKKEDSPFTSNQIYTEEPVIQMTAMKTIPYPKL